MKRILDEVESYGRKAVITCSSVYHVLVAVCLVLMSGKYGEYYLIMFSPDKADIEKFHSFSEKLDRLGIHNAVIYKHTRLHRAVGISNIQNRIMMRRVMKTLNGGNGQFLLINCSWNQQKVNYPASMYLKKAEDAVFIEEGATQFITPGEKQWYVFLKKLYGNQTEFWKMDKVRSIYVQNPDGFPWYLKGKLKKFSLKSCIGELKKDEIEKIISIFVQEKDKTEINKLRTLPGGIIFTQPLSEDGYISENEKKRIYGEMSRYYARYGTVYLKVHPRDTTHYRMEHVIMLEGSYPSEILSILGISFDFAIGLCTSAVETVISAQRKNLNEKFLTELRYELIPLEEIKKEK